MHKTARILYFIVGVIMPILVGILHMMAHFKHLNTPEVEAYLQKDIAIFGNSQPMWYSWGIMSVMMGMSFIVIGLLNLHIIRRLSHTDKPPIPALMIMVIYLVSVVYVGYEFKQNPQFYGGLFGLVLTGICTILSLRK